MNVCRWTARNFICNQKGQSLVSLLTAIPVVVLVSLSVATMVHATYNEVYRFRVRNEANSLQQALRTTLDSRAACASSLTGTDVFDSAAATSANGMDMNYRLEDGSVVGSNVVLPKFGIRVNSLKFKAFSNGGLDFASDPRLPGNQLQYGELVIRTEDLNPDSRVVHREQSLGGVVLSVATDGNISRCFLLDQGFDLCTQSGGTEDASGHCTLPALCPIGSLFTGFDGSMNPICVTPATLLATSCPAGMLLVSNGAGNASCQLAPTPTPAATATPVPTPTVPPTVTPTVTPAPSPTPTVTPSASPTVTPTVTPVVTPTVTPTVTPSPTASPSPTATPVPTPTPVPSPTPTPGPLDPQIIYTQQQLAFASTSMSAQCKAFLSITTPIDLTATNDVTISGTATHYVLDSARNFTANGIGAQDVTVNSAINVPYLKGATNFYIRTQYLDTLFAGGQKYLYVMKNLKVIFVSAGPICASAETIETINGASGNHQIIAKSVGLYDGGTGSISFYGATVNTVKNYVGTICLFNGAKILNLVSSPLATVRTDCP